MCNRSFVCVTKYDIGYHYLLCKKAVIKKAEMLKHESDLCGCN